MSQTAVPPRCPSPSALARALRRASGEGAAGPFCAPLAMLLSRTLRFDAADPLWPDRDRLLIPNEAADLARHAAGLLGLPATRGLADMAPEPVGLATGAALAERMLAARFGRSLVDHRAWVLADAARLATGPVQEAACLAGLWRLGRLAVVACEQGDMAAAPLGAAGFAAFGWTVRRAADLAGLDAALSAAQRSFKPTLILCALPQPGPDEAADPHAEAEAWRAAGRRGAGMRRSWLKRLARHAARHDLEAALARRMTPGWHARLTAPAWLPAPGQALSTAQTVRLAMADLAPDLPSLAAVAGDVALAPRPAPADPCPATGALALGGSAALAGLALHGGVLPVAAWRASMADQLLPALGRSAAAPPPFLTILVEAPGASCGAWAGLRAKNHLLVLRPADAAEALECLELALRHASGPSLLLVCEQAVPALAERPARARAARGAHLVAGTQGQRAATLLASGPDLHVALAARSRLLAAGLAVAVVSLPCWGLFAAQDAAWRAQLLGTAPLIGLEASDGWGWERWLGAGLFVSLLPEPGAAPASPDAQADAVALAVARHLNGKAAQAAPP